MEVMRFKTPKRRRIEELENELLRSEDQRKAANERESKLASQLGALTREHDALKVEIGRHSDSFVESYLTLDDMRGTQPLYRVILTLDQTIMDEHMRWGNSEAMLRVVAERIGHLLFHELRQMNHYRLSDRDRLYLNGHRAGQHFDSRGSYVDF